MFASSMLFSALMVASNSSLGLRYLLNPITAGRRDADSIVFGVTLPTMLETPYKFELLSSCY
jgi:hypothetical protein